jgi:hypothetical protein
MIIWAPKKPTETAAYVIDWAAELGGDQIASQTLTVASGTATVKSSEILSGDAGATSVRAIITGGTDAATTIFNHTITTDLGQIFTDQISLFIDSGSATIPSTVSKRTIINMAFEEIGLAGYEFDATPEEQTSALRRLDALMLEWAGPGRNMDLGYNRPTMFGGGDLDEASLLPDWTINTVVLSLALRIMPALGKTLSAESRIALANGINALRANYAVVYERSIPSTVSLGAGMRRLGSLTV